MAGKVEARRAALREALIEHAERRIVADGLKNLRARDLARDAGCALGAIYTVFGDLGDLVLAVNVRTLKRFGAAVAASLADAPEDATQQLIILSQAYHHFAAQNFNAWRALFDIEGERGTTSPDWYMAEMDQLFAIIDARVAIVFPHYESRERGLLTKGLFSSVHGIVRLSLEKNPIGVPTSDIDELISMLFKNLGGISQKY